MVTAVRNSNDLPPGDDWEPLLALANEYPRIGERYLRRMVAEKRVDIMKVGTRVYLRRSQVAAIERVQPASRPLVKDGYRAAAGLD
jgi:hypothetical protein